jgi:isopenicillin-N epimerase
MNDQFLLDPSITFLNFGSFGACPKPIFEKYQAIQLEMERDPVRFMVKSGIDKLNQARQDLANYVGCQAEDLVYVTNPSYAINTIAKSIRLKKGDEVLSTNLEYGALVRTWDYYCEKAGARFVQQKIQLPIVSKEAFINNFWKGYTVQTKVIFISQITSSTGLILPVKEICEEAKKRGLLTIVDGAHVPGHIPLNINDLMADVYTGACHKWMMAPKGSSFLYVNKENQHWVDPLLISWGFKSDFPSSSTFIDYHQTAGTRDFSAFLTVPFCIEYMQQYNWVEKAATCQELVISNAKELASNLDFIPISPIDTNFIGQLFSIPIQTNEPISLYNTLYDEYAIQIPVTQHENRNFIRFSIQVFNSQKDIDRLAEVLLELKGKNRLTFV